MVHNEADERYCPVKKQGIHCAETNCTIKQKKAVLRDMNEFRSKPTKIQMRETISLLSDFGIHRKIPECKTYDELLRWRKKMIMDRLN
jgi:hypothetical protein